MKNLSFLITISIVICSASLNAQWVQITSGGPAWMLAISGTSLFAAVQIDTLEHTFFVSTDEGATWTPTGYSGKRGPMALAGNGINIYAGYYFSNGLLRSTNNGIEWENVNSFPSTHWITALALDAENVLVGTMGGVHLSLNNGIDWTSSILGESIYISSLIFTEANIFAGTKPGGIFLSTDNGGSWIPVNNGLTHMMVNSLAVNGNNIFAATDSNGVYLSNNNGSNWTQINDGLNNSSVSSFAVSGNNIFAGTDSNGVFISTNNGTNWAPVNDGLTSGDVYSLTVDEEYIFAGTGDGVLRRPLSELITGIDEQSDKILSRFVLEQNYPNPLNPSTTIKYSIPKSSQVMLKIFNTLGEEIETLVNEEKDSGVYSVSFDASGLASGMYLYKLQAGAFVQTRKMILLK